LIRRVRRLGLRQPLLAARRWVAKRNAGTTGCLYLGGQNFSIILLYIF
jgi:hypothetical protein